MPFDITLTPVGDNGLVFTPRYGDDTVKASFNAVVSQNFEGPYKTVTGGGMLFYHPATLELRHFLERAGLTCGKSKWAISYDPPPIPVRDIDWQGLHDDYDGAPTYSDGPVSDGRCLRGSSVNDVLEQIEDFYPEEEI